MSYTQFSRVCLTHWLPIGLVIASFIQMIKDLSKVARGVMQFREIKFDYDSIDLKRCCAR